MSERASVGRVFVVGCPRSGTTLLQTLLGAHPDVVTFPETHLLARLVEARPRPGRLGLVRPRAARAALDDFAALVDAPVPRPRRPTLAAHLAAALAALDGVRDRAGAVAWVEKTPRHLHHLDLVDRHAADAAVVHVVRAGAEVARSLHRASTEHPDAWTGPRSVADAAARWSADLDRTRARAARGDAVVRYHRLVDDPDAELDRLCARLGWRWDDSVAAAVAAERQRLAASLADGEPWKAGTGGAVAARPSERLGAEDEARLEPLAGPAELDRWFGSGQPP